MNFDEIEKGIEARSVALTNAKALLSQARQSKTEEAKFTKMIEQLNDDLSNARDNRNYERATGANALSKLESFVKKGKLQ